ncbi:MAG: tetratricopeptide repeat protein [Thermodesulfobacteriota bacterium]
MKALWGRKPGGRSLLLAAAFACLLLASCSEKQEAAPAALPEILKVTPHSVTVAWQEEKPGRGRILFEPAAGGERQTASEKAESRFHEVEALGLAPGTRYSYRLSEDGPPFQFQTQPQPADPFSFVLISGGDADKVQSIFLDEVPEFFVELAPEALSTNDAYSQVRPFVPVFTSRGLLSPFLSALSEKPKAEGAFYLDWGGLRLVFLEDEEPPPNLFDNATAHTFGAVLPEGADFDWDAPDTVRESPLHQAMLRHNARNPDRKAAFILVQDGSGKFLVVDEIAYAGIPEAGEEAAVRLDVDASGVRAVDLAGSKEFALKKPPVEKKLTCADCRRLADQGTYEEAVRAYQAFIENNRQSFQVDDALYAIAEIQDQKLFRPAEALTWYDRLVNDYPEASLAPLARQRATFLRAYADFDFKPLAAFERIRQVDFLRAKDAPKKRDELLQKVGALMAAYPKAAIAPAINFWLANQYREFDPEKAVSLYRDLIRNYPESQEARESYVQIGDTWYAAGRFRKAMESFREAGERFPDLRQAMEVQAARCRRNMLRVTFARVMGAIAVLIFAAALFWPPVGMPLRPLLSFLAASGALFVILALGAWLIREQFSSNAEMWLLSCSFALAPTLSGWVASTLSKKALGVSGASLAASILLSLVLFVAVAYLCVYFIYIHYLIIIGL